MYENRHGRFTAVDPLLASGKSANPQTFNRFVYTLNSPINLVDPSGLSPDDWYVKNEGEVEVFRTDESSDRYYAWDSNKNGWVRIATLKKKEVALPNGEKILLVQFPQSGYGFGSYNSQENGANVEPGGHDNHGHFGFVSLSVTEMKHNRRALPILHSPRIPPKDLIVGW